eukprot:1160644-Pelagomonas_calceolata.AAC.6
MVMKAHFCITFRNNHLCICARGAVKREKGTFWNIADTIAKELGSIGGLAGPVWAGMSEGLGGPLSQEVSPHSWSILGSFSSHG